jgi:hypothetical protein
LKEQKATGDPRVRRYYRVLHPNQTETVVSRDFWVDNVEKGNLVSIDERQARAADGLRMVKNGHGVIGFESAIPANTGTPSVKTVKSIWPMYERHLLKHCPPRLRKQMDKRREQGLPGYQASDPRSGVEVSLA